MPQKRFSSRCLARTHLLWPFSPSKTAPLTLHPTHRDRRPAPSAPTLLSSVLLVLAFALSLSGCSRLKPALTNQYVYVTAKQTFLRDRVAAVSNRTGSVENGDKLQVLERGRRFVRVSTPKGEQGWIDEKTVVPQDVYDSFESLKQQHANDAPIASAVVRDEVYLHVSPGRDTEKLFRLGEGDKLKLLKRATLVKALPPGQRPLRPVIKTASTPAPTPKSASPKPKQTPSGKPAAAPLAGPSDPPAAPIMEDWWLVRDAGGRTGWMLSRMMDVDAPDSLTRYAEGQRFVGAYIINKINDPEAPMEDKDVPEYVTVLSPYKAGLPYDFDQVRVFIWNRTKHRYETGFRQKNIEGYLPVVVKTASDPYGKGPAAAAPAPTFLVRVLPADVPAVTPDPATGAVNPPRIIEKTYRLEGNQVRRLLPPDTAPPEEAHPEPVDETKKKSKKRR